MKLSWRLSKTACQVCKVVCVQRFRMLSAVYTCNSLFTCIQPQLPFQPSKVLSTDNSPNSGFLHHLFTDQLREVCRHLSTPAMTTHAQSGLQDRGLSHNTHSNCRLH